MRLHDLTVGQRFTFTDKHRGKVFEVTWADSHLITYRDVATNEYRHARSNREMFRKEVRQVSDNRPIELTKQEVDLLIMLVHSEYKLQCETGGSEAYKGIINALFLKLTGLPGRRAVRQEGE